MFLQRESHRNRKLLPKCTKFAIFEVTSVTEASIVWRMHYIAITCYSKIIMQGRSKLPSVSIQKPFGNTTAVLLCSLNLKFL